MQNKRPGWISRLCSIALGTVFCAQAVPNFDPVTGPPGSLIGQGDSGGNVWQGVGTDFAGAAPSVILLGLSDAKLPAGTGNSVSVVPGSGQAARVTLNLSSRVAGSPVYYSLLLKVTDLAAVPTTSANNFVCAFSDTTTSQPQGLSRAGARLVTKRNGLGYQLGIGLNSTEFAYATDLLEVNETVFVVAAWTFTGTATNANLWINPARMGENGPPSPSAGVTNGALTGVLNANGPRAFLISCLYPNEPAAILDEIRVHTNWTYVTGGNPAVLLPPASQTLPPGSNATFTVSARGTPPLAFRWLKNGNVLLTDGSNISGSSTSNLTLTAISPAEAGSYSVIVSNGAGICTTSSPAILAVSALKIVTGPQDQVADYGTTARFDVGVAGEPPFFFQWLHDGSVLTNQGNISGAQTNPLLLMNVCWSDVGSYFCVVSNQLGHSQTSGVATLLVRDPVITRQPASLTNFVGATCNFRVEAAGTPLLTYRWLHNGTNLMDGADVAGTATDQLILTNIKPASRGGYYAVVCSTPSGQCTTSAPAFLAVTRPQGSTPNFLVIITDDHRWDSLGVVQREMGTNGRFPWFTNGTPNLDRLAAGGIRFRNAFVTLSLCSPSRAAILTGRYNHLNGVINNSTAFPTNAPTYASRLRDAGYVTGMVGKWHMGSQVARPGFDYSASFLGQGNYNDTTFYVNGTAVPSVGWIDDVSTDYALAFINQNSNNAFALHLGFKTSHGPHTPPPTVANLYSGSVSRDVPNLNLPPPYRTNVGSNAESTKRDYHRCVTAVDADIGRILDRLDELGITTNTVVVFLGDNGFYLGEHGLGDKRSLYEESLRIPMLVRYPRLVTPGVRNELVLNIDIAATILDLAGLDIPSEMQGRSWRPLLSGAATYDWRQSFLAEYFLESGYSIPTTVIVRTTEHKLVFWPGNSGWSEMFDLVNDPYETLNLFNAPGQEATRLRLRTEFDRCLSGTGLGATLRNTGFGMPRSLWTITGGQGPNYEVQSSSDLLAWTPTFEFRMDTQEAQVTLTNNGASRLFHRLRWISD